MSVELKGDFTDGETTGPFLVRGKFHVVSGVGTFIPDEGMILTKEIDDLGNEACWLTRWVPGDELE